MVIKHGNTTSKVKRYKTRGKLATGITNQAYQRHVKLWHLRESRDIFLLCHYMLKRSEVK